MELVQNNICMVQQRGRSVVMRRAVTVPVVLCRNAWRFLEEHASGLKAEAAGFAETSASAYNTTWCHKPEDHSQIPRPHCSSKLRSHIGGGDKSTYFIRNLCSQIFMGGEWWWRHVGGAENERIDKMAEISG